MNDEVLIQQLKKTGNLMDLYKDGAFVRSSSAIEADCGGAVEAGLGLKSYMAQIEAEPPATLRRQRQAVKALSILLPELRQWLEGWQLGLCFEAVYTEAQHLIYKRFDDSMVEQQDWICNLLIEDEKELSVDDRPVRGEAIRYCRAALDLSDESIAPLIDRCLDLQHELGMALFKEMKER